MRIAKLKVDGFGCLRGEFTFSSERINLIIADNEQGKSTLVASIIAALFGLARGRRRRPSEHARYEPWTGGSFGLTLDATFSRGPLSIRKNFEQRSLEVRRTDTQQVVTADYLAGRSDEALGENLLGVTRQELEATSIVRQGEMQGLEEAENLTARIQSAIDQATGRGTAAEAEKILGEVLRSYPGTTLKGPGMIETEITRVEDRITALTHEQDELAGLRRQMEQVLLEIEETDERLGAIGEQSQELEYRRLTVQLSEAREQLTADQARSEKLAQLNARKKELEPWAAFPADRIDQLTQCSATLDQAEEAQAQLEGEIDRWEESTRKTKSQIEGEEKWQDFGMEELSGLRELRSRLTERERRLKGAEERLKSTQAKLEKELEDTDTPLPAMEEVAAKAGELTSEEMSFALSFISEEAMEEDDQAAALRQADEIMEELEALQAAKQKAISVGVLLLLVTLALPIVGWALGQAGGLVGGATLAIAPLAVAIRMMRRASKRANERRGELVVRRAEALGRADDIEARLQEDRERLTELGKQIGCEKAEEFHRTLAGMIKALSTLAPVQTLREEIDLATEEIGEARSEAQAFVEKHLPSHHFGLSAGDSPQPTEDDDDSPQESADKPAPGPPPSALATPNNARVRELEASAQHFVSLHVELKATEDRLGGARRELQSLKEKIETNTKAAREILSAAGMVETALESPESRHAAIVTFREGIRKHEEFLNLTDHQILPLQAEVLSAEKRDQIAQRIKDLEQALENLPPPSGEASPDEAPAVEPEHEGGPGIEQEIRTIEEQREALRGKRTSLSQRLAELNTLYSSRETGGQEDLNQLLDTLDRTLRFKQATELAIKVLREVSEESHQDWASILNKGAGAVLSHISPNYGDLRFAPDLSFTLQSESGSRRCSTEEIDQFLSWGARDQIYLAVRIAISDYLSRHGEPLPLILDEPFGNSDDDRFEAGFHYLVESVLPYRQLIILSCHHARHDWLRERNPEWFDNHIQLIALGPSPAEPNTTGPENSYY